MGESTTLTFADVQERVNAIQTMEQALVSGDGPIDADAEQRFNEAVWSIQYDLIEAIAQGRCEQPQECCLSCLRIFAQDFDQGDGAGFYPPLISPEEPK